MKTLLLMRHAKASEQEHDGPRDFDRPITDRGRKDAARIGRLLAEKQLTPALIISSSAERTKQTVNNLVNELSYQGDVFFYNELYEANLDQYAISLSNLKFVDASPVLLVGHNPTIQQFISSICASSETMNTATIAHIEVGIDSWAEFNLDSTCKLRNVWRPKELQ